MGKSVYIVFMYLNGVPYLEVFEHDIDAEKYRNGLQRAAEKAGLQVSPILISMLVREDELDINGEHFHVLDDIDECSPNLARVGVVSTDGEGINEVPIHRSSQIG